MKTKFNILGGILIMAFSIVSCQKDLDYFVPDAIQPVQFDTNWVNTIQDTMPVAILQRSLLLPVYSDSFFISGDTARLTLGSGLTCSFRSFSLAPAPGQTFAGMVYTRSQLLTKRGEFIQQGVSTISGSGELLHSKGTMLVSLKNAFNNSIQVLPGQTMGINVPVPVSADQFKLYYGNLQNPASLNWLPNAEPLQNQLLPTNQGYYVQTNPLGWIAIANKVLVNNGTVVVTPKLASKFTNANTLAFVVLNDVVAVAQLASNVGARKFESIALPAGRSATVITISKLQDVYYWGKQSFTTVASSAVQQQINITPAAATLQEVIAALGAL